MGIFQKVEKATQLEKYSTRHQPIKQVFLQDKITKCTIITGSFSSSRALFVLYLVQLNNNEQFLDEVKHNIINYQCRAQSFLTEPKAET